MTSAASTSRVEEDSADQAWQWAYKCWLQGDPEQIAQWVRNPESVIVPNAREFLADFLLNGGQVRRKPGNKPVRSAKDERQIVAEVYAERERLELMPRRNSNPSRAAMEIIAKRRRTSAGTIRGVIQNATKVGITFKNWQQWGRPFLR
jgi:hypothetical protein